MAKSQLEGGYIFDIQGFSIHDGPGCRTLIFLKGCTLTCDWCSNPEGIDPYPQPLYRHSKCIFDGLCQKACPKKAIVLEKESILIHRDLCRDCRSFACVGACFTGALKKGGYFISTEEIMRVIRRDRNYWGNKGGITLTGGEPFFQPEFAADILRRCHESYIHTAVETCGNIPWKNIDECLPWLDWIFFDLKHPDTGSHAAITGSGNALILENARRLSDTFKGRLIFRIPVIPGYNDSKEEIAGIAGLVRSFGRTEINILPVHHLGREKYKLVGRPYYSEKLDIPSPVLMNEISQTFSSQGIRCYIGSETPF